MTQEPMNIYRTIIIFIITLQILPQCICNHYNLHGKPGDGYYITVNIGIPPQQFNLLIDTGSSNLAVAGSSYPGLERYYLPQKSRAFSYQYNGSSVKVVYLQGWWEGVMGKDKVQIASLQYLPSVFTDLSIITKTHGFYVNNSHWQGILGLAYSEIAKPEGLMISWLDSLSEIYPNITNHRFDLELCGPQKYPNWDTHNGRFSLGKAHAVCRQTEFTTILPRRWYYEVVITGVKVGDHFVKISCMDFNTPKTIVDSGTSNLQFSSKSYDNVLSELQGQVKEDALRLSDLFWLGKEEICFPHFDKVWDLFPVLTIFLDHGDGTHFGLQIPPSAYLRPALNHSDKECWLLGIEKATIGTVLGTVALEGFCLVFDRKAGVISFEESSCGPQVSLSSIQPREDTSVCHYEVTVVNGPLIASSIILTLMLLPLLVALVRCIGLEVVRPRMSSSIPFIAFGETNT